MLIGTYRHQLDQKARLRMPTKFKEQLGSGFIIAKGTSGCLFAFSKAEFEKLYEKLENVPMFDLEAQKPIRALLASAFETEEDGQGRLMIPKELRSYASLSKNVVSIGVGNRVEIWAEEKFDKNEGEGFDEAAAKLASYGV